MSQPCSRRLTGPEVESSRLCLGEGHVVKLVIFFVGTVNPLVIKPGLVLLLLGSFKDVNAKVTGFAAQDDG